MWKNVKIMVIYTIVKRTATHECFAMVKRMFYTLGIIIIYYILTIPLLFILKYKYYNV